MILDNLENFKQYVKLHKRFEIVNDFLSNNSLENLEVGRHELDGDSVYVSVQEYTTKLESTAKPEDHKKYIDVQIVISGCEKIGYCPVTATKQYSFYEEDKDIEFLNGEVEFLTATPDKFFIFYPQDAHMPSIALGEQAVVKKAVFKVKID